MVNTFIIVLLFFLISLIIFLLVKVNNVINQKLTEVKSDFVNHLSSSQETLVNIASRLTELKISSLNILEVAKDIKSLEELLKPPKLRGQLGELLLDQILSQVLPPKYYETSYRFQSGDIVDAVIKLKDSKILCIDAKFPLDALKNYNSSSTNDIPTQFIRDVKKHIDAISTKYILPNENTFDFALMYIPAENVYYEIILRDDKILQYARDKHVVPVSPISLYTYLSTILIGLKGMEVEKNAKQILGQIGNIKINLDNFINEYNTVGLHLSNAKSKYDISKQVIDGLSEKLKNIEVVNNE